MATVRVFALAIVCIGLCACDETPSGPSQFALLESVIVTGPVGGAPGETLRFTATARYSDGTSADVTNKAGWSATASSVNVTGPGVAVAVRPGEATLRASYTANTSSSTTMKVGEFKVFVLVPGTFKLIGTLTGPGGLPVRGRVDVLSGVGAGLFVFSTGEYSLYGVAGPVQLQASAEGYFTQTHNVTVSANDVHDFALVPLLTPGDAAGVWTMTIDAPSPVCPAGLPPIGFERSYRVALTQTGSGLKVNITSPTLIAMDTQSLISGSVSGTRVSLDFQDFQDDFGGPTLPNLLDRLSPTETLSFAGRVGFDLADSGMPATLNGQLSYFKGTIGTVPTATWACTASDHRVTMRRETGGSH